MYTNRMFEAFYTAHRIFPTFYTFYLSKFMCEKCDAQLLARKRVDVNGRVRGTRKRTF